MEVEEKVRAELLSAIDHELARRKLESYSPYAKQRAFHTDGASFRERLFCAGNQLGKTVAGAAEMAMHLTGLYPDGWTGRVFTKPIAAWASGVTGESVRDTVQRLLVGRPGEYGTGMIPHRCIVGEPKRAMGVADLLDSVTVKHKSGGNSRLYFKRYEQGREKWQGETLDVVWFDEECPADIYAEGLTRTNATGGMAYMTFTPLQGMSDVVRRFLVDKSPDRSVTTMTIDDAEHYTPEERARIVAGYQPHEREARANGIPTLGSGRIFPVPEEDIKVAPFSIPKHWARLVGGDFGWAHPSAWVWLAHDRDTDIVYVTHVYRCSETLIPLQALTINAQGQWIPVSWPHDGYQVRDAMHGEQLAQQYRDQGVNMRPEHAQFEETQAIGEVKASRISTEAGIQAMLTRMTTGKFKVFSHLEEWFDEFRLYHRKNGVIVKERDDLLSATRIGLMDLRYAIPEPEEEKEEKPRRSNWRVM